MSKFHLSSSKIKTQTTKSIAREKRNFETKNGSHSELVATLQDEDMFYKCADVFISLALLLS